MMRLLLLVSFVSSVHSSDVKVLPAMPSEYSAVLILKMPYIGLEMPLSVLTSAKSQKLDYYDGLQVEGSTAEGTTKFTFNNSKRVCMYTPTTSGPKLLADSKWTPMPFLPDLAQYKQADDELVGGTMCNKYVFDQQRGSKGTMDDHIAFYWDPVLNKPVRWHVHARPVTFGSHTDEYIFDFVSFKSGSPAEADLAMPEICDKKLATRANVSIQIHAFLKAAHGVRAPSADEVFDAFLKHHGKSYDVEEHSMRQQTFARNLKLVSELNQEHAGKASFSGKQFLDMTRDEMMRFRGGKRAGSSRSERRTAEHLQFVRAHKVDLENSTQLPKSFDWRTAQPGVVGPVKDQAFCGSCWTYGLMGPVAAMHAIKTGRLLDIPEQFVLDCTWTNNTGESHGNLGCDGGDSDIGALEIIRKFGGVIPSAAAYGSYMSANGYCKDTRLMEVGAKITGWVDIKDRDEQGLLNALVTQGPLNVNIMVPDEMLFYDSGVLSVKSCKNDKSAIDHAVVLVGYGTDENGVDYYTVRNSWSTYWGDEGYIKVARGDNDCAIASDAGYPEVEGVVREDIIV